MDPVVEGLRGGGCCSATAAAAIGVSVTECVRGGEGGVALCIYRSSHSSSSIRTFSGDRYVRRWRMEGNIVILPSLCGGGEGEGEGVRTATH